MKKNIVDSYNSENLSISHRYHHATGFIEIWLPRARFAPNTPYAEYPQLRTELQQVAGKQQLPSATELHTRVIVNNRKGPFHVILRAGWQHRQQQSTTFHGPPFTWNPLEKRDYDDDYDGKEGVCEEQQHKIALLRH